MKKILEQAQPSKKKEQTYHKTGDIFPTNYERETIELMYDVDIMELIWPKL